jgi:class 3 adenylate cyclase
VEAIRTFLRTVPPAILVKVLLPHGGELARLAPEVAERLGHVPPAPSIGPEEERLRLYEALAGFFVGISREQPLALFLDDLQWAASIDALHHLARNLASDRLLVVGAYRDVELKEQPVLARGILAMNRERLFHTLPLKRLEEPEVARILAHTLGEALSGRVAEMVYQKTEGNPFFVDEVARYLTESGAVTLGEQGWELKETALMQLPDSVKAVVGERLERLGEEDKGVLTWASVAGREFTLPLLKEVTELEEEKLQDLIDNAVAARVLTLRPSLGQEVCAFVDNQIRDVLYGEIGPMRRRRYHLRVGQAMEKVHARRLAEHYDALAHHFLEGNDLEKAAEYAIKAGDQAASIYSWERAIGHYQTALEVLEELEADPRQQAEVLEKLGQVTELGRGRGAVDYWEKALSIYETLKDNKKAGEVHLRLGDQMSGILDAGRRNSHSVKAVALLEPEGESPQLALAYVQLGSNAVHGHGERSTGVPLMEKGLALAERLGDSQGVMQAARRLGHALVYHTGEISRGLGLYQRSFEEARKIGNLLTVSEAATALSREYASLRDTDNTLRWAEQAVEPSKQAGTLQLQVQSALGVAWACILQGDAARARLSLGAAEQVARKAGVEFGSGAAGGGGGIAVAPARLNIFLGEWDKAETELLQLLEYSEQLHSQPLKQLWANPAIGFLYLERSDFAMAKTHLGESAAYCQAMGDNPPELYVRTLLVQVCSKSGELDEAEAHLRRAREIFSLSPDWLGLAAEVHLAEGVLATAQRRWPEAEAAFQKAVAINRQYHLPYYEARSLLEWGEMYSSRNEPQDPERGLELLDQALAIFQRVQAKKMVEKVLASRRVLIQRALEQRVNLQGLVSGDVRTSIDAVASAVQGERPNLPRLVGAAPDGTVTILFSDIEGSTTITERLGDQRWLGLLHTHNAIIREQLAAHAGFEVKSQGDGFMLAFQSARRALQCAIAIQQSLASYNNQHHEEPIRVRIGLHTGEAIKEADDFFGKNVILAARIAGEAQGGQILVSGLLKELTESSGQFTFDQGREIALKGLSGLQRVFQLSWQ